jgi:lipoyl-dependent peroxiredoxin
MNMAAISRADATWEGDLVSGGGHVKPESGAFPELPITWASRAERQHGKTSPEELIAAAHASCFSMAFSNGLAKAGHKPERLDTRVEIEFVPGTGITTSTITVRGHIHGISNDDFQKLAKEAEEGCPVSKAMHGNVELRLHATLDAAH